MANIVLNTRLIVRHDVSTEWTAANPILASGEAGVEIDTNLVKYGDGKTEWNALPYSYDNIKDNEILAMLESNGIKNPNLDMTVPEITQ